MTMTSLTGLPRRHNRRVMVQTTHRPSDPLPRLCVPVARGALLARGPRKIAPPHAAILLWSWFPAPGSGPLIHPVSGAPSNCPFRRPGTVPLYSYSGISDLVRVSHSPSLALLNRAQRAGLARLSTRICDDASAAGEAF